MHYCSQMREWTKYNYNGHKFSQITDYCGKHSLHSCIPQ